MFPIELFSIRLQCEILEISVKNYENIIIFVKHMLNLRALHVQCENDNIHIRSKFETIQWLKDRLPLTCLISRDPDSIHHIRIWM